MRATVAMALLALAGCGAPGAERNEGGASNLSTTNGNAPASPPAPVAESPLVGRWADLSSSCATPVEIFGNGTFRAVDGSRGHWRHERDQLRITVGARVFNFRLVSVTRDRIVTIDDNGQRGESVRCN